MLQGFILILWTFVAQQNSSGIKIYFSKKNYQIKQSQPNIPIESTKGFQLNIFWDQDFVTPKYFSPHPDPSYHLDNHIFFIFEVIF